MNINNSIDKQLEKKYHKTTNITNFKDMLYNSANLYAKKTAFKLKNSLGKIYPVSYEQFKTDVIFLGTYLIEHGYLNKRISVIGKNSYNWCTAYLAATIVGVVVPIDKELHTNDVVNFMNISETECILGDNKILKEIQNNDNLKNKNTLFIYFNDEEISNISSHDSNINEFFYNKALEYGKDLYLNKHKNDFDLITIDPDEMRILLFTSGTTGKAKGVCLSQRNICSNMMAIYGIVKVRKSDLFFSILPLHHTYECTIGFLLPIYSGACIAYCEGLRYISKNIQEYHPSVILCVPLLLEKVHKNIIKNMNQSLPEKYKKSNENPYNSLPFIIKNIVKQKIRKNLGGNLRVFIVGAAAANPNIIADFKKFGLLTLQGYGLTECSPLVAGNNDFFQKDDSAGLPLPNVVYKIYNPNEEGVGEIIVKGPNVMLGYYNDLKTTSETIIDGWFHTGDLGKIDENKFLYITGRCKSVIITKNGKNIYPEELEYLLNDNIFVTESLVLGMQKENDDETYVYAKILPNIEEITSYLKHTPSETEINKVLSDVVISINNSIPNYKHIKNFIIQKTPFEKTTTQKIKRFGTNISNNI